MVNYGFTDEFNGSATVNPSDLPNWPSGIPEARGGNAFMIRNLAIGGYGGGPVPESFTQPTMTVDYVRVWLTKPRHPLLEGRGGARRGRGAMRVATKAIFLIALVCVLAGVTVLVMSAGKVLDPFAGSRQYAAQEQLYKSWAGQPGPVSHVPLPAQGCQMASQPRTGRVFAIIQIPALGKDWKFTVIEGTDLPQLATGPGHVPGTALPGAEGNVGIAAHDVTAGNPFLHLASLKPGDTVTITTQSCVVTYTVTRLPYRVLYTDVGVLRPAGAEHMLTMITCWPVYVLYFVPHRTIVSAIETSSRSTS
jgi:sortase A